MERFIRILVLLLTDRKSHWLTKVCPLNLYVKICSVETANLHWYIGAFGEYYRSFSIFLRNVSQSIPRFTFRNIDKTSISKGLFFQPSETVTS